MTDLWQIRLTREGKTTYKKNLEYSEAMMWRDRYNHQGYDIVAIMRMNQRREYN